MRNWTPLTLDDYEGRIPTLEQYIYSLDLNKLKAFTRLLGDKDAYKGNKMAVLKAAEKLVADPDVMRRVARELKPIERDGLALLKLRGRRAAYAEELAAELLMVQPPAPAERHRYYGSSYNSARFVRINELMQRGLVLRCDGQRKGIGEYYLCEAVGVMGNLLDEVDISPPPTLAIHPVATAVTAQLRRPAELMLRLTAFLQAFIKLGSVQLTAKGLCSKQSVARLSKLLGWRDTEDSLTPLPDAAGFYLALFEAAGLLKADYQRREVVLNPAADGLTALEQPFAEQSRLWAQSYRSLRQWVEYRPSRMYIYEDRLAGPTVFNGLRAAVLMALAMLPDPAAWYSTADLSDAICQRIGGHFAFGYYSQFHPSWNATPEKVAKERAQYDAKRRADWQESEGIFIVRAITGPLFHLGLVELARNEKQQSGEFSLFRLTDAGRAALYDIFRQSTAAKSSTAAVPKLEQPCWIVQPNFDVVVYLDHATPRQLGFVERIGERQQADEAVVTYRLTRESIYAALESGIEAKALMKNLQASSRHPLPAGVARTLEDWAGRRERLAVRLNANVLEFSDPVSRDGALSSGQVKGEAVGDRFIILAEKSEQARKRGLALSGVIIYEPEPPKCLSIRDDGTILIDPTRRDLLIAGELAACSEPTEDEYRWRLSRASVTAALARGWTAEEIINRLARRAKRGVPPFLRYAIHGWSGHKTSPGPMALPTVPVLQAPHGNVADAINECSFLRPYLLSRLGPCAFVVKPGSVKALLQVLREYGFEVGKDVLLQETKEKR